MKISRPVREGSRAFTLVELLVVISIIAILAALVLATTGHIQETAGIKRATSEIAAVEQALSEYKLDYGDYPVETGGGDDSTEELLQALHPQNGKIYLEQIQAFEIKKESDSGYYSHNRLIDPFGRPYHYYYNPDSDRNSKTGSKNNSPVEPDIWSYGKDGESRNSSKPEKWIKNW